uniref:Uncharacterized protein n=1 Tax=Steinernema glaseri TaxID=37863 RepID=A0A1I8ALJ0_9BILA
MAIRRPEGREPQKDIVPFCTSRLGLARTDHPQRRLQTFAIFRQIRRRKKKRRFDQVRFDRVRFGKLKKFEQNDGGGRFGPTLSGRCRPLPISHRIHCERRQL